jgi:transcription-repair coupling factor (superfamily II helicase)
VNYLVTRISSSRFTSRFKDATILKSYEDLRPGDYVVHEYNGIGQFLEIKTLEVDGAHRDYLHIAYAGNESLYVPLEQFRLVRKYSGREGAAPKLSHLSSGEWEKRKAHIKERVNELADRLLALYGTRAKIPGFAFPGDDEFQKKFEDEFPYTLTEDQQRSLDEIKADMEKPLIMDRLLCGDVGFGGKRRWPFGLSLRPFWQENKQLFFVRLLYLRDSIMKSHLNVLATLEFALLSSLG